MSRAGRTGHRTRDAADDFLPVIVPLLDRNLVPASPDRRARLARHLDENLHAPTPTPAKPRGSSQSGANNFTARVLREACTLCRGWCCRNGADDAYLDGPTLARILHSRPELSPATLRALLLARVPDRVMAGSCIFHGAQGCTLGPDLRSDICNRYYCGGLAEFLAGRQGKEPVVVFAGEGARARRSPLLIP